MLRGVYIFEIQFVQFAIGALMEGLHHSPCHMSRSVLRNDKCCPSLSLCFRLVACKLKENATLHVTILLIHL